MAEPFLGEVRLFAGNYAPQGWAFCDGSPIPISENEALYSLIQHTYGGDEQLFNLPDLRGRVPVHTNNNYALGVMAGQEAVTLGVGNLPPHNHTFNATTTPGMEGDGATPANTVLASNMAGQTMYRNSPPTAFGADMVLSSGGGLPHNNMQPYVAVNYIIAVEGIYPPQP